ncbi:hypothetical protein EDB83DRAFT_2530462 [Lactarius deliciosus]|nr:hypothetical protein EDB83DRAFT_2530462 [Lactarius deliciosus]
MSDIMRRVPLPFASGLSCYQIGTPRSQSGRKSATTSPSSWPGRLHLPTKRLDRMLMLQPSQTHAPSSASPRRPASTCSRAQVRPTLGVHDHPMSEQDRLRDVPTCRRQSFGMIARADAVQLARLPGFGPPARAVGDTLEPPRYRRGFPFDHNSLFPYPAPTHGDGPSTGKHRREERYSRAHSGTSTKPRPGSLVGAWPPSTSQVHITSYVKFLFCIISPTSIHRGRTASPTELSVILPAGVKKPTVPVKSTPNPRKTQPFCDCPTSSSAKKSDLDASYGPTRSAQSSPQESTTTLPEMTLPALACLVAFAVTYGLSPAVPEMPSTGAERRRSTGARWRESGSVRAQHDRPGAARECPGARAMTSMLPSLRLRGVVPACKYLLCDPAAHLHLLRAERRSWPRQLLDIGKAASSTRSKAKHALPEGMTPKGNTIPGPTGRSPPVPPPRNTRSAAKASTRPSTPIAATGMEQTKPKTLNASTEAKKALKDDGCYIEENPITSFTLLRILTLIIMKHSATAPKGLTRSLQALAALMHENNVPAQQTPLAVDALALKLLAEHGTLQNAITTLGETTASLEKATSDMAKSITEATTVTTQAASTARSYKEALTNTHFNAEKNPAPSPPAHTIGGRSPQDILAGVDWSRDKKSRQVFFDSEKGEDSYLNTYEIQEKADKVLAAINSIIDGPPDRQNPS